MTQEDKTTVAMPFSVALKGRFSIIPRCPECKSHLIESAISEEADWVCDDLDFLLQVLRDEIEDLTFEYLERTPATHRPVEGGAE